MNEDIRDIHGPIVDAVSTPWWPYALIGVAVAAVIAAVTWALLVRRRRARTPEAIALHEIERSRKLIGDGNAHALALRVSGAVRGYVEAAFSVHAPRQTTDELLNDLLRASSPVAPYRGELGAFLELCDLAKYARFSLSASQMTELVSRAERFVRATAHPVKAS